MSSGSDSSHRSLQSPPDDAMPGPVDLTVLLGIARNIAVGMDRFRAWPSGFQCILSLRVGQATSHPLPYPQFSVPRAYSRPVTAVLGLEYADGAVGDSRATPDTPTPTGPASITVSATGSGSNGRFDITYWITPLPPPGPLAIWFTWTEAALPRLTARIDAEPLRRAAEQAVDLWS
jgi:hypothetical protein